MTTTQSDRAFDAIRGCFWWNDEGPGKEAAAWRMHRAVLGMMVPSQPIRARRVRLAKFSRFGKGGEAYRALRLAHRQAPQ